MLNDVGSTKIRVVAPQEPEVVVKASTVGAEDEKTKLAVKDKASKKDMKALSEAERSTATTSMGFAPTTNATVDAYNPDVQASMAEMGFSLNDDGIYGFTDPGMGLDNWDTLRPGSSSHISFSVSPFSEIEDAGQ